jgi:7-cyano-7-deazaguanine synthase in queuosine biosynthesis
MKLVCAQSGKDHSALHADVYLDLFEHAAKKGHARAGYAIKERVRKEKLQPNQRAWDLLSLALSAIAADLAGHRARSADGWTRQFQLRIEVNDPAFWNSQAKLIEKLLCFLTTDTWQIEFLPDGFAPAPRADAKYPDEECITLLSGGLDSLVGAIDLVYQGVKPLAVSQVVRGDAEKQDLFAEELGGGLRHLQFNHNAELPDPENPPSQRARSISFLAYGVLAATTLDRYRKGETVTLYVCENGFIGINPPLTGARIGSLSTRTTHPVFFALFQQLLDAAGLRVKIVNPYRLMTKGEMLKRCKDQTLLKKFAHVSTSCGRFKQFGYKHCGRCVPCLIRRAAFLSWGFDDATKYKYKKLSVDDTKRMRFDDVRSAMMAIAEVKDIGIDRWLSASLSSPLISDSDAVALGGVVSNGLGELRRFLVKQRVR